MECSDISLVENREYLHRFRNTLRGMRVPFSGSIDFTSRCNLRCVHCYAGPAGMASADGVEMPTGQVLDVLDQITGAGCLFLLITGGEPLLRDDFAKLYTHAKKLGLLVTLFTNGTLITPAVADLFAELPPRAVEITLYGATAATHDRITGTAGSFEKTLGGIKMLRENGIRVRLKTILMTLNKHELRQIEQMAAGFKAPFRMDASIFPRLNGDREPLKYRVPAGEAVEMELSDGDRFRGWLEYAEKAIKAVKSDKLYWCGAGECCFHVDSRGILKPCLMSESVRYRLSEGSFSDAWKNAMVLIGEKKASAGFACNKCGARPVCNTCPAFFALENGNEETYSKYLCEIAMARQSFLAERVNSPPPATRHGNMLEQEEP